MLALAFTGCDADIFDRTVSNVPAEISNYLNLHFPDENLLKLERDREYSGVNSFYEAYLSNGLQVHFTKDHQAVEIEGEFTPVPLSTLPDKIREYITENFPENDVWSWEKYPRRYEVYLDTEWELFFDENGNFTRLDD